MGRRGNRDKFSFDFIDASPAAPRSKSTHESAVKRQHPTRGLGVYSIDRSDRIGSNRIGSGAGFHDYLSSRRLQGREDAKPRFSSTIGREQYTPISWDIARIAIRPGKQDLSRSLIFPLKIIRSFRIGRIVYFHSFFLVLVF